MDLSYWTQKYIIMATKVVVTKKDIEKYPNNYDLGNYIREKFITKENKEIEMREAEKRMNNRTKN